MKARSWIALLVVGVATSLALAPPGRSAEPKRRTETKQYIIGADVASSTAFVCPLSVGGACFDFQPRDRRAAVTITDVTGSPAHAFYQIFDKAGATHSDGVICGRKTLTVPVGATQLAVYVDSVTLGAVGCAAPQGPTGGTTGEIRIVFDQGTPRPRPRHNIDTEQECFEAVPASIGSSGVTDAGQRVKLNILMLLDGVAPSVAKKVLRQVATPYRAFDIDVVASGFRPVRFRGKEASGLISQAKALYGGVRPRGTDVVYVLTSKNIEALGLRAPAGLADCIGGVRYANRAFATGEAALPEIPVGPFRFYVDAAAKTAAHEIGHLLGGHHHHANCVESAVTMSADQPTPCTLMSNFLDFLSFRFGTLEGSVIRGHTIDYASP